MLSTVHFLATDFNTFIPVLTVNCNTHEVLFAQPNPFLPFLSHLRLPSPETASVLSLATQCPHYIASGQLPQKTASCIVACWFTASEMCLLHCCMATNTVWTTEIPAFLLLRAFALAGMRLPSCYLAVNYSGFQVSCHIMKVYEWAQV
jgi:hypothetical protein